MKVLEFLQSNTIEQLQSELGIKVSRTDVYPDLYVLNYNQIESPKTHPVVKECRSLVLESVDGVNFTVVSRSFDRFLNLGEGGVDVTLEGLLCYEKVDGSLIGVFYYRGEWLYRTKSMLMPTNSVNGFDTSWKEFIEDCLNWKNFKTKITEDQTDNTFIMECVGRENRIVVTYPERNAYLLAVRNNVSGEYIKL